MPLSALVSLSMERAGGRKDPALPYVGLENLTTDEPRIVSFAPSTASISVNNVFRRGDILFGKLRPNLRKSAVADVDGYCSTDILVLRTNEGFAPSFAAHALRGDEVFRWAVRTAFGTKMPRTSWESLRDQVVFVPLNIAAQSSVAKILDTFDNAIRSTEALIAKLENAKRGLLHDLLTRGIDHNGEIRDPGRNPTGFGDSALGRIPSSWGIHKLGTAWREARDGPFGSNLKSAHYQPTGVRVIRLQNIGSGEFQAADKAFVSPQHAFSLRRHDVRVGDLLVASLGDENHPVGRACLLPDGIGPSINKADCFRIRMNEELAVNSFVAMVLNCPTTRRGLNGLAQGVTRDRVNLRSLGEFRLALPPVPEQVLAVDRFESLLAAIRMEMKTAQHLRFLKSGLAHDLLTGRVRVAASMFDQG